MVSFEPHGRLIDRSRNENAPGAGTDGAEAATTPRKACPKRPPMRRSLSQRAATAAMTAKGRRRWAPGLDFPIRPAFVAADLGNRRARGYLMRWAMVEHALCQGMKQVGEHEPLPRDDLAKLNRNRLRKHRAVMRETVELATLAAGVHPIG